MKKLSETTQGILSYLAIAGILTIAVTAPYALAGIARLYASVKSLSPGQTQIRRISQALAAAKRSKLIIVSQKPDGKFLVELSEKGRRRLKEVAYENLRIPIVKPWDAKWRIVIFDIPSAFRKSIRNALTLKLKKLGFFLLQKSVWVHAYPCENEIRFVAELLNVSRCIHIIVAESLTNDVKLYRHFQLS